MTSIDQNLCSTPKPQTLHLKRYNPNPKSQTRSLKPQTAKSSGLGGFRCLVLACDAVERRDFASVEQHFALNELYIYGFGL